MANPAKKSYEVRRIFIASPGDLIPERMAFREVIEAVNEDVAKSKNILLEAVGWEDTLPGKERAQKLINQDLLTCDLIVMLLWKRWGTPTGKYSSGFEEEFRLACHKGKEIFLYFKDLPDDMLADPGDQLKQVLTFRDEIEQAKKPFFKRYADEKEWQKLVRNHLCGWLNKLSPEIAEPKIAEYQQRIQELEIKLVEAKAERAKAALHMVEDAEIFADSGQLTRAEESFAKAIALCPSIGIINDYALFLIRIGSMQKAEENLLRILGIARSTNDKQGMGVSYGNLGIIYQKKGDLDKAKEFYTRSLVIDKELGSEEGMAVDYCNLGYFYLNRGSLDKAEELLIKAQAMNEKLGRKEGLVANYCNLGILYKGRGDLDKAEEMHFRSLAMAEATMCKEDMAINYRCLGSIYYARNDLDRAEKKYRQSLEIDRKLSNKEGIACTYCNLGVLYRSRGNLKKAEELYKEALFIAKELGYKEFMAIGFFNQGNIHLIRGNFDDAEEAYKKSLAFFIELGDEKNIGTVRSSLELLTNARNEVIINDRNLPSGKSSKKMTPARRRSPKSKTP
jgi:tetratricopeptide (TPR) repeat protein